MRKETKPISVIQDCWQVQNGVFWDFLGLVLSKVIGQGAELITISLIAHRYGLQDYSILIFAMSATGVLKVVGCFGLDKWVIREIAVKEEKRAETISKISALQLQWLFVLYIFYALGILIWLPEQKMLFLAAGLYQLIYAVLFVIYGVAAGYERFDLERITSVVIGSVLLTMVFVLYLKHAPVELMILAYIAAALAGVIFALLYSWEILGKMIHWRLMGGKQLKQMISATINFGVTDICNNLQVFMMYLMIDRLLVDKSNVGLFNASFRVIIAILFVFQLFMKRMYPILAKKSNYQQYFYRNMLMIIGIGILFHWLVILLAPFLITIIFGSEFASAVSLLKFGSAIAPIMLLNEYFVILCAVGKRENEMKRISFIGILTLTIAGCYWIPRNQVLGVMWAYLVSEFVKWLLYYWELTEHCHSQEKVLKII